MKMQGWTLNKNFFSDTWLCKRWWSFSMSCCFPLLQIWGFVGGGLCGLILLQGWDVQRRRGPPAPLPQLSVLEKEVEGGQGDTGLCRGLTERVRCATVQVGGLGAILPTRSKGHRWEHQAEDDRWDEDKKSQQRLSTVFPVRSTVCPFS